MANDIDSVPTQTPQNKSEAAMHSIHRANRVMSVATVVALVLIVSMLGFALVQLQNVVANQQAQIKEATERNTQLINELKQTSDRELKAIGDYLECIAKTNPATRTDAEVEQCLDILRKGGSVSASFFTKPHRGSVTPCCNLAARQTVNQPQAAIWLQPPITKTA